MDKLLKDIRNCTVCLPFMKDGVNPVLSASSKSKIAIIGQAPGSVVHKSGIPWDDKSGERLRSWMDVDADTFYNEDLFAIIPMGFCYPGKGKSGDLAPRKECAPLWHKQIFDQIENIKLTLLIGQYAQKYYLKKETKNNLTETVRSFEDYLPDFIPLPHPSPRNNIWLKKNDWFEELLLPVLKANIKVNLIN